eukprot:95538_1
MRLIGSLLFVGLASADPEYKAPSADKECGYDSYCKYWLDYPVCHGSYTPCTYQPHGYQNTYKAPANYDSGYTAPHSDSECGYDSYCKYWLYPAVCQGTYTQCSYKPDSGYKNDNSHHRQLSGYGYNRPSYRSGNRRSYGYNRPSYRYGNRRSYGYNRLSHRYGNRRSYDYSRPSYGYGRRSSGYGHRRLSGYGYNRPSYGFRRSYGYNRPLYGFRRSYGYNRPLYGFRRSYGYN